MNILQDKFVEQYCLTGNATQSAIVAGYSPKTAGQKGHELKQRFFQEIEDRTKKMVQDMVPVSLAMLRTLVESASSEAVRLSAVKDVLDRSGMKPIEKVQTSNIESTSKEDLEKELAQLLKH